MAGIEIAYLVVGLPMDRSGLPAYTGAIHYRGQEYPLVRPLDYREAEALDPLLPVGALGPGRTLGRFTDREEVWRWGKREWRTAPALATAQVLLEGRPGGKVLRVLDWRSCAPAAVLDCVGTMQALYTCARELYEIDDDRYIATATGRLEADWDRALALAGNGVSDGVRGHREPAGSN